MGEQSARAMGKSKDDNRRKRSSPSSPRDETRSKRHKSKEDDKKHKSRKKHKSDQSSKRHSDKDKKSGRKHKHKSSKHDIPSNKYHELSSDDYFSKNNEFALWLKEEREIFFNDLSSEAARDLFSEFVSEWNNKELEPRYYEGITTGPRTAHRWNIKQ